MLSGYALDRRKAPRVSTNGKMPGRLFLESTGEEVVCCSYDVSRIGFGIGSDLDLAMDTRLYLVLPDKRLLLTVVSSYQPSDAGASKRFGLLIHDSVDIEAEFREAGCMPEAKESLKSQPHRIAPRFVVDQEIRLRMQTFGTQNYYDFVVENLSQSGLLAASTQDDGLPFRVNTLVDMTIDMNKRAFKNPILATGKIVRRIDSTSDGKATRIGIAIVDVEPNHQQEWSRALEELEHQVFRKE